VNSPLRSSLSVGAPSGAMLSDGVCYLRASPLRRQGPSDLAFLEHARQLLPALPSTAVPDVVLPPPSMGSYLLHPCSRPSERGIHAGFSLASRRASVFLLRGQEKVTKEKATPKRWSPGSCPPTPRQDSGGSLTAPPCAGSELGAIPRAHPAGLSCALTPPLRGPISAHRARQSKEQSQSQSHLKIPDAFSLEWANRRSRTNTKDHVRGSLLRLGCARCAVDGAPMQRQRDVGRARRVGARDCAQFDVSPGMDCRRTSGVTLRSRRAGCPETVASGWPSLWLLSLGHARESDSLAGRRVNTRHGCRAPKERASKVQSQWAPACAGATEILASGYLSDRSSRNKNLSGGMQ
jgi:hypothetical protein